MHTHLFRNWILLLVVGLLLVGLAFAPGIAASSSVGCSASVAVAVEPTPTPSIYQPGDRVGTNGFAWGG
jgi:hypothetical protein